MQILPGSANLFGGRGVTLKNVPSLSYQGMKFPGAPHGLKMACGENPKRVYGNRDQSPSTRMGNVAAYRNAWIRAQRYQADWDRYNQAVADANSAESSDDGDGASVADALLTNTPPAAIWSWKPLPTLSAVTFSCTCIAIGPTRCSPFSIWPRSLAIA